VATVNAKGVFMFSKRKENDMLKKALSKAMSDIDELKDKIERYKILISDYDENNDELYEMLRAERRKTGELTKKLNDSMIYKKYNDSLIQYDKLSKKYKDLAIKYDMVVQDFTAFILSKY
jgi:uncharacterized coiled-coil DUF342 family protein